MSKHRATNRVVRAIAISVGIRSLVLQERRLGPWLQVLTIAAASVAVWAASKEFLPAPNAHVFVAVLLGVIGGIVAWVVLPWNGRVRIDLDSDTCEIHWRFFAIPISRRRVPIAGRTLDRGHGVLTYDAVVTSDETDAAAGCALSLILGPLAWFLSSPKKREKVKMRERHEGLVLRDADGTTELLLAIDDIGSLDEALPVLRQVVR